MRLLESITTFLNQGHERSVKAKKHIIYSLFLKGISIVIGLLFVPLLLNYLDTERYGVWLTLTSIVGWFTFFDVGLGNGLRNNLTRALAGNDLKLAREYVSTTYAIITLIFLAVLIIFYFVNPFLNWSRILNTVSVPEKELSLLALIVFTFFILRFIFNLIGIILLADQRPAINNAFGPAGNLVSLIIIYMLMVTTHESLVLMGFVLSVVPVVILILATIILFNGRYRDLRPELSSVRWGHSRQLMGLGIKFFILQVSSIVLFSTSNIIITQVLGAEQVTVYNIAFKYFQVPTMIYGIVMIPIWSAVTDAFARGDMGWLQRTLRKLNLLSVIFFFGILLMLILSGFVYRLWVGSTPAIPFKVSAAMAAYAILMVLVSPYSAFINGFGKLYLVLIVIVISTLLYIPLAVFLSKTSLGLAGVILATCIVNGINAPVYVVQTHKIIHSKARGIWFR